MIIYHVVFLHTDPQIDGLIYIENTSKTKVLGSTSNGTVIQEFLVEDKAD